MHSYREFQGCVHYVKRKKKARKIYGKMRTCTITVGAQKPFFSLDLGATVVVGRLAGTYDLRHSIAILYFASVRGNAV